MKVELATPCSASWDEMEGDDRVRHCSSCRLNVYNADAMTETELANLIRDKNGNVCVRLFQRADGTVITRDCPVGLGRKRRRRAVFGTLAASVMALAGWLGIRQIKASSAQCNSPYATTASATTQTHLADVEPFTTISRLAPWLIAPAPTPVPQQPLMGKIAAPIHPIQTSNSTGNSGTGNGSTTP